MTSPIWITPAGSLGIIPDEEFYQFILSVYDASQTPQEVSGTVSFDTNRVNPTTGRLDPRIVYGTGTSFTTELEPGDRLISEHDVVLGVVSRIVSDTELFLFQDATFTSPSVTVRSADNITFTKISGELPVGLHIDQFGNMSGVPINGELEGVPAAVQTVTTSTFTIRATNRSGKIADRTFNITVAGVNPISISPKNVSLGEYFDGDLFSYQLNAYNYKTTSTVTWTVDSANLPIGVTLDSSGLLRGYIHPDSIGSAVPLKTFNFTVSVTDGFTIDSSNYSIDVYNRALFTADSDLLHADNTNVDISITKKFTPVLYNFVTAIDTATQGNYYAYHFIGDDFNGDNIEFSVSEDSEDALPAGLTLDSRTGWLTGSVPFGPLSVTTYNITIRLAKTDPTLSDYYVERTFALPVVSQISNSTIWNTSSDLGAIENGSISTLFVSAYTPSNRPLQYRITNGRLPPGLSLTVDGLIIGRPIFEAFMLDHGTTTFKDLTTFDEVFTFTIEAYSSDLLVVDPKDFFIRVATTNVTPYENLYIRALPSREQRFVYNQLINNTDIFPLSSIYRASDPWFGKNINLRSLFLTGLAPATDQDYLGEVAVGEDTVLGALTKNHYRKTLTYGDVKTARALDENFNVKYEVVYVDLIDTSTNSAGESAPVDIILPENSSDITDVYPNSFDNMRDRIVNFPTIGYTNKSILPEWMTSRQENGNVLGFTRALVLAYTEPNKSSEIAYRVTQEINNLKLVGYTIDRYEWDHHLSSNWVKESGSYVSLNITGTCDSNVTSRYVSASLVSDPGTITFNTSTSQTISGTSTYFSSNVEVGDHIVVGNLVLGTVGNISSNTSMTLVSLPAYDNFEYTVVRANGNTITGNGTISFSTTSADITGIATRFSDIIVSNVSNCAIEVNGIRLGNVSSVTNDTRLVLTSNASVNVEDDSFGHYGTRFTTELNVGDNVVSNTFVVIGEVSKVINDYSLRLVANATVTLANSTGLLHNATLGEPDDGMTYLKYPEVTISTNLY